MACRAAPSGGLARQKGQHGAQNWGFFNRHFWGVFSRYS